MRSEIKDLMSMNDADGLYELLSNQDDEVLQFDAAEALVKMGDRRGLEFIKLAATSEIDEVREVAEEILELPDVLYFKEKMDAEQKKLHEEKVVLAKERLRSGKKVYGYKVVFVPGYTVLTGDVFTENFQMQEVIDAGLEGWEAVNFMPNYRNVVAGAREQFTGLYVLLKKELSAGETIE